MRTRRIKFSKGATPPHPYIVGLKFSGETEHEQQAIAYFAEYEMRGDNTCAMSFNPALEFSVIWISARTPKLLEYKIKWVKDMINNRVKVLSAQ